MSVYLQSRNQVIRSSGNQVIRSSGNQAITDVRVPASRLGRRSSVSWRPLGGWQVASKGLGPLPRRRGSALAHGCAGGGRVVLPLARAAAVSTGVRVLEGWG